MFVMDLIALCYLTICITKLYCLGIQGQFALLAVQMKNENCCTAEVSLDLTLESCNIARVQC